MIRRAWSATAVEGPSRDRFANAIAARVSNEIEPPFGVDVALVTGWLGVADDLYAAAGEPLGAEADAAAESADLTDLYEFLCGE